jgi:hypothetical protein
MPNAWTNHIKQWAKENNMSYMCALSQPAAREAYKKPEKVKKTKTPKQPNKQTKQKLYNDEVEKLMKTVRADFIPAMKEVASYIKKIIFSKKPPTQKAFDAKIVKIKKDNNVDYYHSSDALIIKDIYDDYNKENIPIDELIYNIWRDSFLVEFFNYWLDKDVVKTYMDLKGLDFDDAQEELDNDEILADLAIDEYNKFFTDKWFEDNFKK